MARSKKIPKHIKHKEGKDGKRKHRWKPGSQWARQVKKDSKLTEVCTKAGFRRLTSELQAQITASSSHLDGTFRFQPAARDALQAAGESFITDIFKEAVDIAVIAGKQTVGPKHWKKAMQIVSDRMDAMRMSN